MTAPSGPRPAKARAAIVGAIAVLLVGGVVLIVLGLIGLGGSRAAAPPLAANARPPVALPATPAGVGVAPALPPSPPRSIDIPAIAAHSVVNTTGLNPDGTLEVPGPGPRYDEPTWYTGSVTPGQTGPSIILGHIDSAAHGPSVFYRLSQLRPLDEFTVTRDDGARITYKVNSVRQYPKSAFPGQEVYGPTTRPELRLITCGGTFDDSARSYRDNTVVFANQISP